MPTILALVQAVGVEWTRAQQERRLFHLCVHVHAMLMERHGKAYDTSDVGQVPERYADEAKEIVREKLL